MSLSTLSAGTVAATSGQVSFADGNGLSFGVDTNQNITMGLAPVAFWQNTGVAVLDCSLPKQSTTLNCLIQHASLAMPLSATRGEIFAKITVGTASITSGAPGGYTLSLGVYTLTQSTAQLASSASIAVSWSAGGASTDPTGYIGQSGNRARSIDLGGSWGLPPGEYVFAMLGSLTGNGASWSLQGLNMTKIMMPGLEAIPYFEPAAVYATATGALPPLIHISDQVQSVSCIPPTLGLIGVAS